MSELAPLAGGRLGGKKGLRYVIEAIPVIIEKHPGAHLNIAGFGPEEPALRRQAESLGIDTKI